MVLVAPQRRRFQPGCRGNMLADGLEELTDEALRSPVCEADLAAWRAHPQQLGRRLLLIGREHHAERREHDIEARRGKGQGFGVSLAEGDWEAFRLRALTAMLEQGADIVGRHYVGE